MAFSVGALIGYLQLDGVPAFNAGIRSAQESLDLTAKTAVKAGAAVDKTGAALVGAGRQADVAATGTNRLKAAELSLVAAQERYNKVTADSTVTTGRLASSQAALLRAQDRVRASQPITPAAVAQVGAMQSKIRSLLGDTVKMAAGFAVLGAVFELGNAIKQANDFQRQMLLIQTQAGASAAEVKNMTAAVLGLSPQVATGPEALALSLYHVESNGIRGAKALDVVRVAAEGAKIGNADLEQTTNALTATVASGIPGVTNMAQAMAILNATVGSGDMKLSDLNEALGSGVLTITKDYGLSLKDVGAALATFGDNNIRGAQAATYLRTAVQAMAVPMKAGAKALDLIGLSADTLKKDMQTGGLNKAILDLQAHLQAAGDSGVKAGGVITEIFGKRAGPGLAVLLGQVDRLESKYAILTQGAQSFGADWAATTKTASFGFDKLKASAESAGLSMFSKVGPAVGTVASDVGVVLPAAFHLLGSSLAPIGGLLGVVAHGLEASGGAAKGAADALHAIGPVITPIAGAVFAMWAAFKGYTIIRTAAFAIQDGMAGIGVSLRNRVADFQQYRASVGGAATETALSARMMQAEFAEIAASAQAEAAAVDRAAAVQASAYADLLAASRTATDAEVQGAAEVAAAAGAQARASALAAAETATAAETAAAAVDEAGVTASAGWAGLAGPLGLAAVGLGVIITLFNKSSGASKEATDAAKAYSDALASGSSGALTNSIVSQLTKNNVPETIDKLNKSLTSTQFSGKQFVDAIQTGGPALDRLKAQLNAVIDTTAKAGAKHGVTVAGEDTIANAQKLLADLTAQYSGLSDEAAKDLSDTKAFAGVSSSIEKVSAATAVGSTTAATYAQMLGIVVDQNGVAAVSAGVLNKAISTVATAYGTATQTGNDFLTALNTFSSSAGTAADRAALIGATLKAANGDNLSYAASLNSYAQATQQFAVDINNNAKTAGESTKSYFASIVNLKKGTIDYSKAAAAPLINDLQGIQTAAMNAAEATYQHELATKGVTKASTDAYNQYVSQTRAMFIDSKGHLTDEAKSLGLNVTQATKLANTYFGMPKSVKTLIEQEGADPVVTVLDQIGTQLSYLTGKPWVTKVSADTSQAVAAIDALAGKVSGLGSKLAASQGSKVALFTSTSQSSPTNVKPPANAGGGGLPEGVSTVGEAGTEVAIKSGPSVQILSHAQSKAFLAQTGMRAPGFAAGTVGDFTIPAGKNAASSPAKTAKVTLSSISITAAGGAAYGIADLIKGNIAQSRLAMRDLSAAVNEAFQLSGVQKQLANVQAGLKSLITDADNLRASVEGTLSTSVDVSKYADIGGLLSALGGGTSANTKFAGELNKLKGEGAPTMLLQQLAQAGPSAGLDTLAGASLGDARQAFGAFNSYISSANLGGNAAYGDVYGARIAADQKTIATQTKQIATLSNGIAKLLAGIGRITKRPAQIVLNGHVIAETVIKDAAFDGVINELEHTLMYG